MQNPSEAPHSRMGCRGGTPTLAQASQVVRGCPSGGKRIMSAVTRTPRKAYMTQNQIYLRAWQPHALEAPPVLARHGRP